MSLNKYMTPGHMEDPMNSKFQNFYWLTLDKSLDETKEVFFPSKRFFGIAVLKIIESYLEFVNTVHTGMFVF